MIALAAAVLSLAGGQHAIRAYERAYWPAGATISVGHCRRRPHGHVGCRVEVLQVGETDILHDEAWRRRDGLIQVHPGQWSATITLGNK